MALKAKAAESKMQVKKLPDLKPKKNPSGGYKSGFNDNITLVRPRKSR